MPTLLSLQSCGLGTQTPYPQGLIRAMSLRVSCKMTSVLFFDAMHATVLAVYPVTSLLNREVSEMTGIESYNLSAVIMSLIPGL